MKFWVKRIETPRGTLVNACDEDLLGREFREGEVVLRVSRSFYGGDLVDEGGLVKILSSGDVISLVGEGCIGVAIRMGLAPEGAAKRVDGVPHLNIYRL